MVPTSLHGTYIPYLEVSPQTLCPRVAGMMFVHAQVHATHENVSCTIIQVSYRGKNEEPNQHIYSAPIDKITQHTRMSFPLGGPVYDLSHRYVLPCETHPSRSPCVAALGLILCSTGAGDSDSMACTGIQMSFGVCKRVWFPCMEHVLPSQAELVVVVEMNG